MALTLPYPGMVFVPLDILTAEQQNKIVANYTYISNQFPIASSNIDFTTMKVWVPDYSNAVNLGGIASYTATSCGWISAHYYNYKTTGSNNTSSIFVNGVRVITDTTEAKTSQGAMASQGTCLIPISTGDVVTGMTTSTEIGDCKFIPGKWVSQ